MTSTETKSSERRAGFYGLLSHPIIYEVFHHLIGARRWMKRFARDVIDARDGDRVFDIGCGPGTLLRYLPQKVCYIGFDRNQSYIERARRVHAGRGNFICGDVAEFAGHGLAPADIAVAIGILHHLDDEVVRSLLRATASALKPGGRLIAVDPCYHPEQSAVQRFIVSRDRGMHVRPFDQYVALCKSEFQNYEAKFQRGHFPFPHSICIIEASRSIT
jgi:SAM-dependent methyltransferase